VRADEYWNGFLYYAPMLTPEDLLAKGLPKERFERFDTKNPDGFRVGGQTHYRQLLCDAAPNCENVADWAEARKQLPEAQSRQIADQLRNEATNEIKAHPFKHVAVSLLLAYRGLFSEWGLGNAYTARGPTWGDLDKLGMADWINRYDARKRTYFNIGSFLCLIILPFIYLGVYRSADALIVLMPGIYCHGMYSLASHFIPRYSEPTMGARSVALGLAAGLILLATIKITQWLIDKFELAILARDLAEQFGITQQFDAIVKFKTRMLEWK
jgi:hypothetical protein